MFVVLRPGDEFLANIRYQAQAPVVTLAYPIGQGRAAIS